MADNYYVYQEPETGKFFYISSDMDMTIGSSMFSLDDMYSGNYSTFPGFSTRPLTEKILQVPEFRQQYEDLLVNFTKHLINPVVMNDRINNLTSMLEEDVAWDKTLPRVGINLLGELASQMTPNTTNTTNSVMTNAVGSTMPGQINMTVATDFASRLNASIPFQQAVNGPTGHISLAGIKEWMNTQSSNTLKFYNTTL
jgi:hypothetical protein